MQKNKKLQGTSAGLAGSADLESPREELCASVNETRETAGVRKLLEIRVVYPS